MAEHDYNNDETWVRIESNVVIKELQTIVAHILKQSKAIALNFI